MAKRILLLAERTDSAEVLARELRGRGGAVETTDSIQRVRERVEADDLDEIVIDAETVSSADAVERKVRSLTPTCSVVVVRSPGAAGADGQSDPATFHVRADRLADLLYDTGGSDPKAFAIESDRLIKVLEVLVGLLEIDDRYFGGFSSQVARLSGEVARAMGMDKLSLDEVVTAALLRDIGKVGVRRDVLEVDDRLTSDQKTHMENHVEWGVRLLEHIDFSGKILPIIRHHHERYDGNGYPDGLRGREIPLGARIINAAESFAAMVSDRPHRPAKTFDRAIDELMAGAGSQFDPEVIEELSRLLDTDSVAATVGRRARVFIVDHEAEYRRLLRMRLLNEGFEVRSLGEVTDDLGFSDPDTPCLLIVDSGADEDAFLATMARIQAGEQASQVPIAVLARAENRALKLQALRHGIEDFILKSDDLEEVTARIRNILTRERRRQRGPSRRRDGVVGRLESLPAVDIVQMLCMGNKTACVRLDPADDRRLLFVRDGQVVHAAFDGMVGEDAFYRLVGLETGEFRIVHGVLPDATTIQTNATYLLMEAVRHKDEQAAGASSATAAAEKPGPAFEVATPEEATGVPANELDSRLRIIRSEPDDDLPDFSIDGLETADG